MVNVNLVSATMVNVIMVNVIIPWWTPQLVDVMSVDVTMADAEAQKV